MNIFLKFILFFLINVTFMSAQEWQTDFELAKKAAEQKKLPIVLVFQGSDWCAPCIKLDKEIWSSDAFISYAKDHYIMLKADFPRRKKNKLPEQQTQANAQLAERYKSNGVFPLVVVLRPNGEVLGKTSYKKLTPKSYIELLNSIVERY